MNKLVWVGDNYSTLFSDTIRNRVESRIRKYLADENVELVSLHVNWSSSEDQAGDIRNNIAIWENILSQTTAADPGDGVPYVAGSFPPVALEALDELARAKGVSVRLLTLAGTLLGRVVTLYF